MLGDGDEIAKQSVQVHELPEDLEGAGKDAFHGEEKRDEVQPFLDGGGVLPRTKIVHTYAIVFVNQQQQRLIEKKEWFLKRCSCYSEKCVVSGLGTTTPNLAPNTRRLLCFRSLRMRHAWRMQIRGDDGKKTGSFFTQTTRWSRGTQAFMLSLSPSACFFTDRTEVWVTLKVLPRRGLEVGAQVLQYLNIL